MNRKHKMMSLIREIISQELNEKVQSISEVKGLGSVNTIFEIEGIGGSYIIRLNADEKRIEYRKEKWCIDKIGELGIPTTEVLSIGMKEGFCFMLQNKIPGINGKKCSSDEKSRIWFELGKYASKYQHIERIEDKEFEKSSFHKDWKSRVTYNLRELNTDDSLLKEGILNKAQQNKAKEILRTLEGKEF
jgi:fructosamine-3-kinase